MSSKISWCLSSKVPQVVLIITSNVQLYIMYMYNADVDFVFFRLQIWGLCLEGEMVSCSLASKSKWFLYPITIMYWHGILMIPQLLHGIPWRRRVYSYYMKTFTVSPHQFFRYRYCACIKASNIILPCCCCLKFYITIYWHSIKWN